MERQVKLKKCQILFLLNYPLKCYFIDALSRIKLIYREKVNISILNILNKQSTSN